MVELPQEETQGERGQGAHLQEEGEVQGLVHYQQSERDSVRLGGYDKTSESRGGEVRVPPSDTRDSKGQICHGIEGQGWEVLCLRPL